MDFRQLTINDAQELSYLFADMYSNLDNLEWFPPMSFDKLNLENILSNSRYFIYGAFEGKTLVSVSSLDYKCSKLIGAIELPSEFDTNKLIELGFSIVAYDFRGQGLMKELVRQLIEKVKSEGYTAVFSKVHRFNFACIHSLKNAGFTDCCLFKQAVLKSDFEWLYNLDFIKPLAKSLAIETLNKFPNDDEISLDYKIMTKAL